MSSAFPNAGGAVEETQGSCMMERRLQRKFEWTELPTVLAEGLLRLHGVGIELAESVFSSDDTGTFTPYKLRVVMHGGAMKRPARFRILLDPPYVWINAALREEEVPPPFRVVKEEVVVLVVLVRWHYRAVGAAVRRAVGDEVPGAVEEKSGPAAVRRVPPGLLDALLPVHALGALGIVVVVQNVGPRQVVGDDVTERAHHEDQHPGPVVPLERSNHMCFNADENGQSRQIQL